MNNFKKPYIIEFPKIGDPSEGYISVEEAGKNVPFAIKRIFWTYFTPESIVRGRHAHYETEQVLIAVAGRIIVSIEQVGKNIETFELSNPSQGLYIPPSAWHTMQYSHNAVQVVFASTEYTDEDYIVSHNEFKRIYNP